MKSSEIGISLNNDVIASFSLLKDVWRGLRWVSASPWSYCIISTPRVPNLEPTWPVKQYKVATICLLDNIPMPQTLYICLTWMCGEVSGGYQPQPWGYGIIFTPQALTYQIWGQLGLCNSIRVQPSALETTYQCLKHFTYVYHGCMERSEVGISLNH